MEKDEKVGAVAPTEQQREAAQVAARKAYDAEVIADKQLRKDMDAILQRLMELPGTRERSLTRTKLQEAIMWLGMDLKRLGEANPYPNSYNPENTKIEPTADGLKL